MWSVVKRKTMRVGEEIKLKEWAGADLRVSFKPSKALKILLRRSH